MATWDLQASAGLDGKSILWRGTWSSASSYNPYDAVFSSNSGSSYISKTNNANKDPVSNPSDWDLLASAGGLSRNYLSGFIMSNAADTVNDITVQPGNCKDSTNSADILLGSAITKQLDAAWVAGTNAGGRDTGAIADGWWHVFVILNPTTGAVDVLFSLSLASPTMPSGFTLRRRIGSIVRWVPNWSGIRPFIQLGDYVQWAGVMAYDLNGATLTNGQNALAAMWIPRDMKFQGVFQCQMLNATAVCQIIIRDPDTTSTLTTLVIQVINLQMSASLTAWTNSSCQLYYSVVAGSGTTTFNIAAMGYWDQRGRQGYAVY